jgi:hypothetical protein
VKRLADRWNALNDAQKAKYKTGTGGADQSSGEDASSSSSGSESEEEQEEQPKKKKTKAAASSTSSELLQLSSEWRSKFTTSIETYLTGKDVKDLKMSDVKAALNAEFGEMVVTSLWDAVKLLLGQIINKPKPE